MSCCCAACGLASRTPKCCPGWFLNSETNKVEACDECAIFESDDEALEYCNAWSLISEDVYEAQR